jgi:hypothetical protein
MKRISFENLSGVPESPGLYEIHTKSGKPLKVGIATNLRRRLMQHAKSRQSRLRLADGGSWDVPEHVQSKQSILAKHLYFDRTITSDYDLRTEEGRRNFLINECAVAYVGTSDRMAARELERKLEANRSYRYLGRARIR